MLGLVRLLLVPQFQIAVNGRAEGLILIGVQDIRQEFVRLVRKVQDLHAVILQQLGLGHVVDGLHCVAGGEIDVLLPLLHPAHILRQRHQLLLRGGVEQQQILQGLLLSAVVVHGAHFQLPAVAQPELLVLLPLIPQQALQLCPDLLLQIGADELQLPVVLQKLTGDVQIQVRRVHHAPDEVEALRHQIGALVHDHHTSGVELQTALVVLGVVPPGGLGWDKQHGLVGHSALGGYGDNAQRWVGVGKALLIELVVLLLGDVALLPLP